MKKNKISRKEFISKTSKVAGGLILCPSIIAVLQSCDGNPVSSSDGCVEVDNDLISTCGCHGAQFNTNGCPVTGPATEPLQTYPVEFSDNQELIIDSLLTVDVSNVEIGTALILESDVTSSIDSSGLLVYRKTEDQFNVLSRECTHQGCAIGAFQ